MKLFSKIFFSFAFYIFQNLERSSAVELKLRVHYELANPTRTVKVNLRILYTNNDIEVYSDFADIKSGENFKINLESKADDERYLLQFYADINPIDNEFVPDENDSDPLDRSMSRSFAFVLWEPNFSNRYLINLGSLEPRGLFNRKIFIDSEKDSGNYHAFLYAFVTKKNENLEEVKHQFLGYAPLSKINEENGSSSQQKELSEYRLSIPIDLTRLFKHQIWSIELYIYQYEESKYSVDPKSDGDSADEAEQICPICLEPLTDGQIIIKLHGENGGKFVHIFHKGCIKEWFDRRAHLRCPFCNVALNIEMHVPFAIFENVANSFSNLYMNSLRELFRIAKGHTNADNFKRQQAELGIKEIFYVLKASEAELKMLLGEIEFQKIVPFSDKNIIEIGAEEFVKNIQKELKNFVNNRQNSLEQITKAENALKMIADLKNGQHFAANVLEKIKNIKEEEEKTKFETLIRI